MRIGMVSAEVAPLAKTGGLADVVAALSTELTRRGHRVEVVMPLYRRMREAGIEFSPVRHMSDLPVSFGPHHFTVSVQRTVLPGTPQSVLCLDCPPLFDREGIYTADRDEHVRFGLLTRAALQIFQTEGWEPDVLHVHDWHAALAPLYLRLLGSWDRSLERTRTVLTIHNIGYQGIFGSEVVPELDLADATHLLHQVDLAAGRLSFLKTGLLYADAITTVSHTYAQEIQTAEHGMGLEALLRTRREDLVGIVNGIDEHEWDPATDPLIPAHFDADDMAGKAVCRRELLSSMGLPGGERVPVFGIISRLAYQKGFELLAEPLAEMLGHHDVRLVVLGSGEPKYEQMFADLARRFPDKACFYEGYNNQLAHLIEAGADAFLMPSRYEPCGLNQMYSQRYGTVPIVRRTGGLADTVELYDPDTGSGAGILFDHFDADGVRWALSTALELYHQPEHWDRMVANGMARDFSWGRQAGEYEALYDRLVAGQASRS